MLIPDDISFVTWQMERVLADTQVDDWLIKDRLEFGGVSMLAASPKAGKSTLVMALFAAIARGTDFFGLPVRRVPILLIDPENRPRFRVEKFDRAADFEEGEANEYYLRPREIPVPVTPEYLERAIASAVEKTGQKKGLAVIDTLRSCFVAAGDFNERDPTSMARLLGRLRRVAEGTGLGLLILHHTTKKGTSFYGTVAIGGAIDFLWIMTSNEKARNSTLSVKGRGDAVEDMTFQFDLKRQRLELAEGKRGSEDRDEGTEETLKFLGYFGWDEGNAITTGRLRDLIAASGWEVSRSFVESRLRKFAALEFLERRGRGNKKSPYAFWVSDAGKKYVATGGEVEDEQEGGFTQDCVEDEWHC